MRGEKCRAITLGCFCRRNAKISLKKKKNSTNNNFAGAACATSSLVQVAEGNLSAKALVFYSNHNINNDC